MIIDSLLIGQVVEVKGTKIKARVFKDKNETYLFHNGSLIKNIAVGGYVKIPTGYDQVIGRIDGEYQTSGDVGGLERVQEADRVNRIIEISVFGVQRGDHFDRGITVLPLVSSNVYILTSEELTAISAYTSKIKKPFRLGSLAGQSDIPVLVPMSALFASHIGVFGNTGSGKSNTLCKFYTDCFDLMREAGSLTTSESRFIIIDFNGEYTTKDVLCPEKRVCEIDTSKPTGGDLIPVPDDFFFDLETWSILTQATEKTQQPFLKSCYRTAKKILNASNAVSYLWGMTNNFLEEYAGHAYMFIEQIEDFIKCMAYLIDVSDLKRQRMQCATLSRISKCSLAHLEQHRYYARGALMVMMRVRYGKISSRSSMLCKETKASLSLISPHLLNLSLVSSSCSVGATGALFAIILQAGFLDWKIKLKKQGKYTDQSRMVEHS